ncbi:MAG: outer membrane protein assembly factor [Taibaiella sp.]|nr:outer membrane protein assembly factor [Taibaiella sp.]
MADMVSPYGNSRVLPNVKQLFSGGISSVRGFNARMIGPGTYNERYLTGRNTYIEMLGDIKLEGNVELRSKLYEFIHGAVFVDAGNVWLSNENPEFPGGRFSGKFLSELAVGTGIGLRLDFSVIMVRLDVGIPVRKPWLPEGNRWVFDQIDFGNSTWRRENIVFGFAIGYPF